MLNAEAKKPLKLFYCYARKDKELRDELNTYLVSLKRHQNITSWHDGEIVPGVEWEEKIDIQLKEAHLILLLVTPHFMESEYCYGIEMKRALERHKAGTARVIPIILKRIYNWEKEPFAFLQALPTDAKAVSKWPEREDALCDIVAGIDLAINELRILLKTAQEWFDEGVALYQHNHHKEAIIAFDHTIHLDPNYALAYHFKGVALCELGDPKEALTSLNQAIHLGADSAEAYYNKGVALCKLRRYTKAISTFDQAIHLDPGYALAYHYKGVALRNLDLREEAIAAYDQAIRFDPKSAGTYYNKGYALNDLHRHEEALTSFDKAIDLNPNFADAYYNRGVALEHLGRSQEAQQYYKKARQLESNGQKPDHTHE